MCYTGWSCWCADCILRCWFHGMHSFILFIISQIIQPVLPYARFIVSPPAWVKWPPSFPVRICIIIIFSDMVYLRLYSLRFFQPLRNSILRSCSRICTRLELLVSPAAPLFSPSVFFIPPLTILLIYRFSVSSTKEPIFTYAAQLMQCLCICVFVFSSGYVLPRAYKKFFRSHMQGYLPD